VVPPSPNGTATPQPDGTISFTPATNFAGEVTFSYVVSDNVGTSSNVARVTVRVLNSKWQNPAVNLDVNNDGQITPADALQIVNYLNDPALDRFLPNTVLVPPPFLDVDGNERVTPNDALLIINYLNERSSGGQGEGESAGNTQFAMMVTPQQMVDTVGAQVVREVERLLSQLREQALAEASANFSSTANVRLTTSSTQWNDEEFLAALAANDEESKKTKEKDDVDEFFADLGPQLT
jgi:hypothetical protein